MKTGKMTGLAAGILCAAFMLTACAPQGPALPERGSAEGRALYEQCMKTLPPTKAAELKNTRNELYPGGLIRHDSLLRECLALPQPAS